ncbi:hypothetical protein D3Y55_22770 [Mesorhizobium sp. DCY119]|nr:hypothetical protein D3Y55_22770 [Mesorhizobium sp. DCY119]
MEPATAVPTLAGAPLTCATVKVSPSASVSLVTTLTLAAVLASVCAASLTATGASLTGLTVTVTVYSTVTVPSFTV